MNISEICIKRPVLSTVFSLILIVIGIFGFHNISTRFLPKFQQNSIIITTAYPGASAKLVETSVTTPIEEAISGIEGIDLIKSQSSQGGNQITVRLLSGYDIYQVANKIRNKIAISSYQLPSTAKPPVVQVGWGSMQLIDIGFTADNMSLRAIRDYLQRFVINRIEQIPGIANVEVAGANKYAMRVWLNPHKMHARQLSVNDVVTAIRNSNIELPAGKITGNSINYPITADTRLKNSEEFADIIVKSIDHHPIYLKDVANIKLGGDEAEKTIVHINGKPGVLLIAYNGTDANPIKAADQVTQLLKSIKQQLPHGMQATIAYNQANYMKASVHEVYISIGIAILCVVTIILLFLGSIRTVLIPITTIPICLLASFGLMYFFGFTINVITLLAIVLSIGLVVDDAIVMLENIYRHIENGTKPFVAAIKGSKEITFAVIAMTLTLAAVYAPIGLIHGKGANIFRSFALTLAGSVIISGFVALTLSPMMCARLLKAQRNHVAGFHYSNFLETLFKKITTGYTICLKQLLRFRLIIVIGTLVIATGGYFLFTTLPKAFMPHEDMGFIITVVHTPSGANLNYTQNQINKISAIIHQFPDVENTVSSATNNSQDWNIIFTTLKPYGQRHINAEALASRINTEIKQNPELDANTFAPYFGGSTHHQLEFYIMGSASYLDLYHTARYVISELKKYSGLKDIQSDLKFNSQQYQLTIDRKLAGNLQVNINTIDRTIADLLGGSAISTFNRDGRDYDVYVQAASDYRNTLNSLDQFYVKNSHNDFIPLANLVQLKPVLRQNSLSHYDRLRAAEITAELAPDYKIGKAIKYLQQNLPKLLPANTKYAFSGQARRILQSSGQMGLLFILAIVFIYLVLSAQFESFLDPLIILLAVPLSIVGALFSLKLINGSINFYSAIGLVTLIGLIAKHGILITQFANKLQKQGLAMKEALLQAASIRLRPILMTTAAMIFGAMPLLFATGASATSRQQIGIVIIGGLFFGTFFSLVLIPITYSYFDKLKQRLKRSSVTELSE